MVLALQYLLLEFTFSWAYPANKIQRAKRLHLATDARPLMKRSTPMAIKDLRPCPGHPSPYPKQTCVTKNSVAKGKVCTDMKTNTKLLLNNMNRVIYMYVQIYITLL